MGVGLKRIKALSNIKKGVYILRVDHHGIQMSLGELGKMRDRLWKSGRFIEIVFGSKDAFEFIPVVKRTK
jgi:hypothetical protein